MHQKQTFRKSIFTQLFILLIFQMQELVSRNRFSTQLQSFRFGYHIRAAYLQVTSIAQFDYRNGMYEEKSSYIPLRCGRIPKPNKEEK